MYSIRIRTNHRLDEYRHGDKANVGVLLKSGKVRFYKWRGFTLDIVHPVKLQVEAFTNETDWDPMNKQCSSDSAEFGGLEKLAPGTITGTENRSRIAG